MKCDYCKKNEATNHFTVSFMNMTGEVHLCGECIARAQPYVSGMVSDSAPEMPVPGAFAVMPPFGGLTPENTGTTRVLVREQEGSDFPPDVGEDIKRRRRLAELKARLLAAIEQEDYESAAELRDELFRAEKERDVYAT